MDIRRITDTFYAAPQICAEDMPALAAEGFKLIICNRPDEEVPPSHQAAALQAAAEAAGLRFAVRPLTHQTMTPPVIEANGQLIAEAEGPVLAYCASGTRSTIAWALGSATTMPVDEIVAAAAQGGYDLRNIQPTLEAIAAQAGTA